MYLKMNPNSIFKHASCLNFMRLISCVKCELFCSWHPEWMSKVTWADDAEPVSSW